ncbi:acetyl/propionyl/methylcrotonyl-CoA carboxylase subunit alpha [Pseudomonas cremoricolorata]|uniref:acetyl/propionyl/methylcrotonyl-CoA carboxylase subunit alpha n=1 Tax=Pseudomonas cremoricolorata TaxID=157783 RepID=UPI00042800A5|nr:acetyl/propionyl/methylcrotonyl-CoA carboxylase subunit alpha [Pseudomonas cremoricolorata]
MSQPTLTTLLVANRGEIACRIMRTAKAMGLSTVAVHSSVDRDARHVREADRRVDLGGAKASESYLDIAKLLDAARSSGAQAIHPGYGFLSENPQFAQAVADAGLLLIGPPVSAIEAMGSKSAAKALMAAAGVPLVPGYHGEAQDLRAFQQAADAIGYPLLLKASAGGGGKGMKVVEQPDQLAEALASAQREAQSAFGDARMLLEKYLLQPRHVEIQVFADQHGHCLYLHERDCSIQRRHQKVVEEAPAPGLSPALRQAMGEAAVRAAQAIGYVGAGTVEFLLDARGDFFFMEMNTRLQVEHPVTEAITGLDLVAWQIEVARGEPLPISQAQVPLQGHAIEVRLYAEDPQQDFLPSTGTLVVYREPAPGEGRRIDSGVDQGDTVSPYYDPMLGKLIAWGQDREQARQRLLAMLEEMAIAGVRSNLRFLRHILAHPAFVAAELDTGFIARHAAELLPPPSGPLPSEFWKNAAMAWLHWRGYVHRADDGQSPWTEPSGLRLGQPARGVLSLRSQDQRQVVSLDYDPRGGLAQIDWLRQPLTELHGDTLYLQWQGEVHEVELDDPAAAASHADACVGGLSAPMNGSIVRVLVELGQTVEAGTALVVLEAMKMEHSIRAPEAGTVSALMCEEGNMVSEGTLLVALTPS